MLLTLIGLALAAGAAVAIIDIVTTYLNQIKPKELMLAKLKENGIKDFLKYKVEAKEGKVVKFSALNKKNEVVAKINITSDSVSSDIRPGLVQSFY